MRARFVTLSSVCVSLCLHNNLITGRMFATVVLLSHSHGQSERSIQEGFTGSMRVTEKVTEKVGSPQEAPDIPEEG